MNIGNRAVLPLKAFLLGLFLVLIPFQLFSLPGQFAHMASENPDLAYLRWPFTAVTIFWVICVQVVIVSTWRLLRLVQDDRIFTEASLVWVDAIVAAIAAGWVTLAATFLFVGFMAGDPGLPVLLFLMTLAVAAVGLLMLVMRTLLRQATTLRSELETVI